MTTRPSSTGQTQGPVSIRDVANAAQVSTATVSRVINGTARVSAPVAKRVHRAIQELGYRPNRFAQGLITRRSHVLGLALPDMHGEYYSELIKGADIAARRLGYHLLITSLGPVSGDDRAAAGTLDLVDGLVIMISEPDEPLPEEAILSELPVVVIDRDLHAEGFDSVVTDNGPGTLEAATHLFEQLGADACHFVGGREDNFDTAQRAAVFARLFAEHAGRPPGPTRMRFGDYSVDWGLAWGTRAAADGVLRGAGVLCANDEIAYGVMLAAHDAGLHPPDDFLLVGFDDLRMARLVRPALSSVHVPVARIGTVAVETLVDRIKSRSDGVRCVRVPTHLVVRDSSVREGVSSRAGTAPGTR